MYVSLFSPACCRQWGKLGGSGAIMSTAVDMTEWIKFHLSQGKNGTGHRVMSSRTVRKNHEAKVPMTSSINKYITVPDFPTTFVVDRYAAAWRNGYYRGMGAIIRGQKYSKPLKKKDQ